MKATTYNGRFSENVLVVGQTGRGKTTFIQNLGKNRMFGDIKTIDWVSKTKLSRNRDEQLRKTFAYASVEFHYLEDVGEFETLLESFREDDDDVENINNSVVNDIVMEKIGNLISLL